MTPQFDILLAPKTTLGIGGRARVFFLATEDEEVFAAAEYARAHALPLRVLGAGSNLLVPDEGIEAVVLQLQGGHVSFAEELDGNVLVTSDAGVRWDTLVDAAAERGLYGVENLAGVPGTVAGAAVQNIGAYGAAFSSAFVEAEVYNLTTQTIEHITADRAGFAYRTSIFKRAHELVILRITLRLIRNGAPKIEYPDLVRLHDAGTALDTPGQIVAAVRAIRSAKFPDLSKEGTAGSFFANPVIAESLAYKLADRFPGLPLFALPEAPGKKKVPLAWILEHVLDLKGFARGPVRMYEKHALVLVTTHGARASEVNAFANEIAQRVYNATSIAIEREVETFCA